MKGTLLSFAFIIGMTPAIVDAAKPIVNVTNEPISAKVDGTSFSTQEIQEIIFDGCLVRGWLAEMGDNGIIRATLHVRSHWAIVEIPFTSIAYSITYITSANLDYNAQRQTIHKNYIVWVDELRLAINQFIRNESRNSKISQLESRPDVAADSSESDIYSELIKLDDLRRRGILTDEEFAAQKKKLLEAN